MLLLNGLVEASESHVTCRVVIGSDSTFAEHGRVPAVAAIEYMAQTVAVFAGLKARRNGEPPNVGYLLGTRELLLKADEFLAGDELLIEARHLFGEGQLGSFDCTVRRTGEVVASAILSVFHKGSEGAGT